LDYGIWGILQAKVNAFSHENKSALRHTIWQEWNRLSEAMIQRTCRACAWRRLSPLMAVIN
jgi:hypothetical protein